MLNYITFKYLRVYSSLFLMLIFGILIQIQPASADPLSLSELNRFNGWVQCTERCADRYAYAESNTPTYDEQRSRFQCLQSCGVPGHTWEKDGARKSVNGQLNVYPIDRHDLKLAILEFQSSTRLSDVNSAVNEQFNRLGFGANFDPSQLICYGDTLLFQQDESAQDDESESDQVNRANNEGSMVIVGTLCPYNDEINNPAYACPYLSGTELEDNGQFYPFCNATICAQPEFDFDAPLGTPGEEGVYWAGNYRPFICPDVVCNLYEDNEPLDGSIELCEPGTDPDVPKWLEETLRTRGQVLCDLGGFGGGVCALDERCIYDDDFGRGICKPRCIGEDACTVAHLELKSETDQEIIAWLYFDHADAPVRALDLHLTYPKDQLVLADSRRLPALLYSGGQNGKQLATQHLPDGTLRLSVFDASSSAPIPYGPIIELVFQRVGNEAVNIEFTNDPELREISMAPNHSQSRAALRNDQVWGEALRISPKSEAPVRMQLWYNFESQNSPLAYQNTKGGEALCSLISECALETEESIKNKQIAQLDRLQSGEVDIETLISGVQSEAAYLNGNQSHLRLPVTFNDILNSESQSFSFSTWFYTEGLLSHESLDSPQVIFAHHDRSERTRFGLWLRYSEARDGYDLEFFDGDLLARNLPSGLETYPLATIPLYAWQHFSFTYDATTRSMDFYLNGEQLSLSHQFPFSGPSPFTCPQFSRNREIIIQKEGNFLGGTPSQIIYYSVKESGLYKIKRRDLYGTSDHLVIGDGEFSYNEPDYSPILDRVVYSSNASGSQEIWIADGDGSNRQQVTVGFGNSDFGFSARSPKWSPDGTGIVFESNAFDVLARDNLSNTVYHLYYLSYDSLENTVSIPLANGDEVEQLNYQERLIDQSLVFYRLTQGDDIHHHRKARWLEGKASDREQRGRLIFEKSDPLYKNKGIAELLIDDVIPLSSSNQLDNLNSGELSEEISLLDAKRYVRATVTGEQAVERVLFKRSFTQLNRLGNPGQLLGSALGEAGRQSTPHLFELNVKSKDESTHIAQIELFYRPNISDFDMMCWDRNQNGLQDGDEDITGDNVWDRSDCILQEINQLFVELNTQRIAIDSLQDIIPTTPIAEIARNQNISRFPWNKSVRISEQNTAGQSYVSVQVTAPAGVYPIYNNGSSNGLIVARFKIKSRGGVLGDIDTWDDQQIIEAMNIVQRTSEEKILIRDLNPTEWCWDLNLNRLPDPFEDRNGDQEYNTLDCIDHIFDGQGKFEFIKEGYFSPDADQLLLHAISLSRPLLLLTQNLINAENILNLSEISQQYKGFSWRFEDRYFPCNWVGAVKHPTQKKIMTALRGGLDELKLHLGVRNLNSIRSESDRGREWLNRGEALSSQRPRCGVSHLECPPFHLCIESECVVTPCDPYASADMAGSCADFGAQCRLRPVTVESEEVGVGLSGGAEYVCVADCTNNRECYTQTCLNGPCLYCDINTSACNECRQVEVSLNGLTASRTEGCPDERTFYCDAGACRTECYSFEDDQSLYLCDPVTEFCEQGRCILRDWTWEDLSPLTLMGAADAQFDLDPSLWTHYTVAIGQSYPLEINAYGVGDYGASPEIMVEVRGGPYYGGSWQQLGRVTVPHRTQGDANRSPMILDSVHPYTDVRLRLISSPYQNVTGSATGLGRLDKDFCLNDVSSSDVDLSSVSAASLCERRANGSRYQLGYRLDLPEYESIQSCRDRGHAGCPGRGRSENDYLHGGHTGVAILELRSNGSSIMNNLSRNQVCSYGGGLTPFDLNGGPEKLFFGRISSERSNQKNDFCERYPDRCFVGVNDTATLNFDGSFALLNCTYTSSDRPSESAYAEFVNIPYLPPQRQSGVIAEDNGDTCLVQIGQQVDVCYEWSGQSVSFDPYTHPLTKNQGFELSVSRSFGHDRGFTVVPPPAYTPQITIEGYNGIGLVLSNGLGDFYPIESDTNSVSFDPIYKGWRYAMGVAQQPLDRDLTCAFNAARSELPLSGLVNSNFDTMTFVVSCKRTQKVTGCVNYLRTECIDGLQGGKEVLLSMTSNGTVTRTQELSAFADASFTFTQGLQEAESYEVSVTRSPRGLSCQVTANGAGVVGVTAPPAVTVSCEDLPEYQIPFSLEGLQTGQSLELIDRESNQSLMVTNGNVDAEGFGNLNLNIRQNEHYEILISSQPQSQNCTISQNIGVIPVGGVLDRNRVIIRCTDLPTYEYSVPVMGLSPNQTVTVALITYDGTEEVRHLANYNMPAIIPTDPQSGRLIFEQPRLYHGQSYRLEIEGVSSDIDQCEVVDLLNEGQEINEYNSNIGSPFLIQCRNTELVSEVFELSGTVEGVDVEGVKLSLNTSTDLYEIQVGATEFTLPTQLNDDATYTVTVARTPNFKSCSIINGEGSINGAHVTNLVLRCESAGTVEVHLDVPSVEGAMVKMELYSTPTSNTSARLKGVSDSELKVEEGAVTSLLNDADSTAESTLNIPDGLYHLYVYLNSNNSFDSTSNEATFGLGDHGFYREIRVTAGRNNFIRFNQDQWLSLIRATVVATVPEQLNLPNSADEASMICAYSPPGTFVGASMPIPNPVQRGAAVVATASRICTRDCSISNRQYVTNEPAYIIPTLNGYDLSCFVDLNDSDGRDAGDLVHTSQAASSSSLNVNLSEL